MSLMAEGEASGSATATTTSVSEPRRLRGHKAATTCCIAARSPHGLVVTSGEFFLHAGKPELDHGSSVRQCLNPAFVHAIAVPEVDLLDKLGKICVLARRDGVVDVINFESECATTCTTKTSSKPMKGIQSSDTENHDQSERRMLHLDYSFAGHTAAVSCVTTTTNEMIAQEQSSCKKMVVMYAIQSTFQVKGMKHDVAGNKDKLPKGTERIKAYSTKRRR